ncbi:hypothetical protein PVK06_012163 [Gossypium arboreum]|uniref:Uncharacterized protein n=1 Tax=Gossypium arboreum TaxID=29729 RepID=A0ABR0QBD6_GOSAR|nr:hypothetical protein PVK06_012163 [Gossypium arboreum]
MGMSLSNIVSMRCRITCTPPTTQVRTTLRTCPLNNGHNHITLERMYSAWSPEFSPIPDENIWPPVSSAPYELTPNMNLSRVLKGSSNFTRIHTDMNIREKDNQ